MRPLLPRLSILSILLAVPALLFWGCDGKTGPAGPAGSNGQPVTVYLNSVTSTPTITPAPPSHNFVLKWGTTGSGDGNFDGAQGIKVNSAGTTVYVQDYNNNRIQYFTNTGSYLGQLPINGLDFVINSDGSTIITCQLTIDVYDGSGTHLNNFGGLGSGPGADNSPSGLCLDPYSNLYVADTGNNRVDVFTLSGNFIQQWGFQGNGIGQFDGPVQVAIGLGGNLYVADSVNHRIEVFTPTGTYLSQFPLPGQPFAMAISPVNQDLFILMGTSVYEYFPDGNLWTQFGGSGGGDGTFACPSGIAVDGSGNIYVSDGCANRVQKFAP